MTLPPTLSAQKRLRADLGLAFCTILWGSTFVVVKSSLDHSSVFLFLALRFTLAGIVGQFFGELRQDAFSFAIPVQCVGAFLGWDGEVRPGDRLVLVAKETRFNRRQVIFNVQGFVKDTMVFHGDIIGVPLKKNED